MKEIPRRPITGLSHFHHYEPILKRSRMEHDRAIGRAIKRVVDFIAHPFQQHHDRSVNSGTLHTVPMIDRE